MVGDLFSGARAGEEEQTRETIYVDDDDSSNNHFTKKNSLSKYSNNLQNSNSQSMRESYLSDQKLKN